MQKPIQVLIVEDDSLVAEMTEGVATRLGFAIVGKASNGRQAVELTRSLHPDVILMDIRMPDMDGIEATRRIRQNCPTPVVVLTADETPDLVHQCIEAGVGAYVVKPPKAAELEAAILIALSRFNEMHDLERINEALQGANRELQDAFLRIKTLSGLLPMCANCRNIRDDNGTWQPLESYVRERAEIGFKNSLCPDCLQKLRHQTWRGSPDR